MATLASETKVSSNKAGVIRFAVTGRESGTRCGRRIFILSAGTDQSAA